MKTSFGYVHSGDRDYKAARFGSIKGALLSYSGVIDVSRLQRLHWDINCWTDDEALAWKTSTMQSCSAISVAGAIFASIGITSLQVPSIDQTHWVVKALLTSSMALGILSSISATSLQRHITYLNDPTAIRLWLSRGALDRTYDRRGRPSLFSQLPLESSVSALQVCDRPSILLGLAFALFIIGFGLYLLFLWLYEIDRRGADSRKVFIFFTCVVCAAVFQKFYVSIDRALEKGLMDRQFNLRPPDTFDKSSEIRDLERKLTQLQSVQRSRQDTSRMEDDDHEYNPFLRGTMRLPRNPDSRLERRGHGEIDAA